MPSMPSKKPRSRRVAVKKPRSGTGQIRKCNSIMILKKAGRSP